MAIEAPSQQWLDQVIEPTIDPERIIVDPHHHLWNRPDWNYVLEHLWADTGKGHNVTKTVFLECRSNYSETCLLYHLTLPTICSV